MNLILVNSWQWAQQPPGVRFRIGSVVVVKCCSWELGMWM